MPFWLAGAPVLGFFALASGILARLPLEQTSTYLAENVFPWFPAAARPTTTAEGAGALVLPALIRQVLIDGIAADLAEPTGLVSLRRITGLVTPSRLANRHSGTGSAAPAVQLVFDL